MVGLWPSRRSLRCVGCVWVIVEASWWCFWWAGGVVGRFFFVGGRKKGLGCGLLVLVGALCFGGVVLWCVVLWCFDVFQFFAGLFSSDAPVLFWDFVDYDFNGFGGDSHLGEDAGYPGYHFLLSLV